MVSWSNRQPEHPRFSELLTALPRLNKSFLLQAVTFSGAKNFRNLSRTDPATISTGVGSANYFHAVGSGDPYIFTSVVRVKGCNLEEPRITANGKNQKVLEGACIEGEWERLVGAVGQIIHEQEYKGQLQAGCLSFGTSISSAESGKLPLVPVVRLLITCCSYAISRETSREWFLSWSGQPRPCCVVLL